MNDLLTLPCSMIVPSPVNKRKGRTSGIDELAQSIQKRGLIQRILVRPLGDKFEIVAGERRWLACSKIMEEMPVEVRELTDAEAHEITFSENFEREQLSPFEEAAFIDLMIKDGKTIEGIADRFGKSVKWVSRRQKLSNLSPEIMAGIEVNPESGIALWPVASLELLSRFEHHIQNDLAEELGSYSQMSAGSLEVKLDDYMMKLDKVLWKLEDETLFPQAGSCSNCCKRTSLQINMFDNEKNDKDDKCLDRQCFHKKQEIFIERKAELLLKKNPDAVLIEPSCLPESRKVFSSDSEIREEIQEEDKFTECSKDTPGAVQALYVDGPMAGKTKWVKSNTSGKTGIARTPLAHEDRVAAISKKRRISVYDKLIAILKSEKDTPSTVINRLQDTTVATMAVIWGCRRYDGVADDPDFDMMSDTIRQFNLYTKQRQKDALYSDLARCVFPGIIEILEWHKKSESVNLEFAEQLTEIFGIDYKRLVTEAELEIKEPKQKKEKGIKTAEEDLPDTDHCSDDGEEVDNTKKTKRGRKKSIAALVE